MISSVKGTVNYIGDGFAVIECNDIGFCVYMPSSDLIRLTEGMSVKVHTHLSVREDDMSLFGFLTYDELKMFRQLITVSGIGPKAALSILAVHSVDELKMAISAGDAKLIASAKGIGLKTAQKLVVELKGKFDKEIPALKAAASGSQASSDIDTAVAFAASTGISRAQCLKALSKAEIPANAGVDEIIDLIFKNLAL